MYDDGKVLVMGSEDPPSSAAEVIDLNAATPAWRPVGSMAFARRHLNATLLPDGKVLVTEVPAGLDSITTLPRCSRRKCGTPRPRAGPRWRARKRHGS